MATRALKNKLAIVVLSAFVATGCSSDDDDNADTAGGAPITDGDNTDTLGDIDQTPDESPVAVSAFREIQDTIFSPICAECHGTGSASAGLQLNDGDSFAALVGVSSFEVATLARVQPGDPDNSYLVQKIEGTQAVGARMPLGGPPLSQAQMDLVRQWITDGAPPEASSVAALPARVVSASVDDDASLKNLPGTVSIVWSSKVNQASFNNATVSLVGSGGDNSFNNGNEVIIAVSMTESSSDYVTLLSTGGVIAADDAYELRISGGGDSYAVAIDAAPIDGDNDGITGGDFVRTFTID